MNENAFLSICIPSYNRFSRLKELLDSIAKAKSMDFEVVVVDNCSPEDILSIGKYDERFKFFKRTTHLSGQMNGFSALTDYCTGRYTILCLDKDFIYGEFLDKFIDELKKHDGIPCGRCILDSNATTKGIKVSKKTEKLIYYCKHPTGMFFRDDVIKKAKENFGEFNETNILWDNPYMGDIIYAYGLQEGRVAFYLDKLFTACPAQIARVEKSISYSRKNNNIYFEPEPKRKAMLAFLSQLKCLELSDRKKKRLACRIFLRHLYDTTTGYRGCMKMKWLCEHYGIETRRVSYSEMINEGKKTYKAYKCTTTEYYDSFLKIMTYIRWFIGMNIKTIAKDILRR